MRKYLLLFAWLMVAAGVYSQSYTVLLNQNFSGTTAGWTTTDNNNGGVAWGYQTNNVETPDFGTISFIDSSETFRFAVAIGDQVGAVNTDLKYSYINCSGQSAVLLEWTQWFAYYGDADGQVEVSTDGTTWNTVYDCLQSSTGENDELVDVDISQYAANQSKVYLKFNYATTTYDIFWAIDYIKVSTYPGNDVAVTSINEAPVTGVSNQYQVNCTFINKGSSALNSVTLNYSINGGPVVSENVTNFSLAPFQSVPYTFQTTAKVPLAGTYPVVVFSSSPNGVQDENPANDTASMPVMFLATIPEKNVLIEEYTTSPCGFCPGGAVNLDEILALDTFAIPVALHTGFDPQQDPLATTAIIDFGNSFTPGESPLAAIDRVFFPNNDYLATGISSLCGDTSLSQLIANDDWLGYTNERHSQLSPVAIVANNDYNASTRELNVNILPTFYGAMTGDFRISCYILEDSIIGPTQVCYYYSSPSNTAINPWYGKGTETYSSSPSGCSAEAEISNYVYNHVVRDFIGSPWGWGTQSFGSGITTPVIDSEYIQSFTYTLPNSWNANHVSLVAFVDEYNQTLTSGQDQVLNSVKMPLNGQASNNLTRVALTAVDDVPKSTDKVSLYPNPANNQAYINYSIDEPGRVGFVVYNSLGQELTVLNESNLGQGSYTAVLNTQSYSNGVYFLAMKKDNATIQTTTFVVSR